MDFLQLNMKKSFVAAVELSKRFDGKENLACLITEPYRYREKIALTPPGATVITSKKNSRAAIIYKSKGEILPLESLMNGDCAVGLLRTNNKTIVIASIYLDINLETTPNWLKKITDYATVKKYDLLIGMDSNAHSVLYGPDSNPRGEELENFILEHGLMVENVGMRPTFQAKRKTCTIATHIDVTLSRGLSGVIKSWEVNLDFNGSDHNTILFRLEDQCDTRREKVRVWDSTNWLFFKDELSKNARLLTIPDMLNEKKVVKKNVK